MDESDRTPTEDGGLDFERADFGDAPVDTSLVCSACGSGVGSTYFTRDNEVFCARCEGPARAAWPPGSAPTRFFGAAFAGTLAAAVASALWLAVTELTGYEIGLIAIAVGWIVGIAIQLGNRGTGGVPYQLLAGFLTYTAIVATYVPMIVSELETEWTDPALVESEVEADPDSLLAGLEHPPPTTLDDEPVFADQNLAAPGSALPSAEDLAPEEETLQLSPEEARLTAVVLAIPFAYALPFLAGVENIIGILIIGFALHQAWRMTGKHQPVWGGPYDVGSDGSE